MSPMPKFVTVEGENPFKEDNNVSEIIMSSAWVMPRDTVCNTGRITKLIPPTEVKLEAVTDCNAVKLSNSNFPLILRKPDATKLVTTEV